MTKLSLSGNDRIVEGFHGISIQRAESAIVNQQLAASHNPWDWLGDGTYFWEENMNRGIDWAMKKYGSNAAVIRANIRLGRCLDLFDSKWTPVLQVAYQRLEESYSVRGEPLPVNRGGNHSLDRQVINSVCEESYEIDTVRGPFVEGLETFPGSLLPNLTHVQIAVRNPSVIMGRLELVYPFREKLKRI